MTHRESLVFEILGASLWSGNPSVAVDNTPRVILELRSLAVRAVKGLEDVAGCSAAARDTLANMRAVALEHDARQEKEIDSLYLHLAVRLHDAEVSKIALLETEAVSIDSLLEVCGMRQSQIAIFIPHRSVLTCRLPLSNSRSFALLHRA